MSHPIYLDCNATTPVDPRVSEFVRHFLDAEFGNAGSRTHEYGLTAKRAVQRAREDVAAVVDAKPDEVVFTSGATESTNLAILGLARAAEASGRRHIITTAIEHKAVLEPVGELGRLGFEIALLPSSTGGWVDPDSLKAALRPDTWLVSIMHVNNETGVIQPLNELAAQVADHPAYFHVDAAQGFGKDLTPLRNRRIDLISASGHKIFAPKGVGALIARRRKYSRPPLTPLCFGGGQERGLRPGTLPVALIAGFGLAARLACAESSARLEYCRQFRQALVDAIDPLEPCYNGDTDRVLPSVVNVSFPGLDSEALMVALKNLIAISNGSACTSSSYEPSHVLRAMGCTSEQIQGAIRISWCHMTPSVDWEHVVREIRLLSQR